MYQYGGPPPYTAPRGQYENYYFKSQYGNGLAPAYGGAPRQRGHGIGSLISGLLRGAAPLFSSFGRSAAKTLGSAVLSTGAGVLTDAIAGRGVKASLKRHAISQGGQLLKKAANSAQGYLNSATQVKPTKRRAAVKGRRRVKKKQTGEGSSYLF